MLTIVSFVCSASETVYPFVASPLTPVVEKPSVYEHAAYRRFLAVVVPPLTLYIRIASDAAFFDLSESEHPSPFPQRIVIEFPFTAPVTSICATPPSSTRVSSVFFFSMLYETSEPSSDSVLEYVV